MKKTLIEILAGFIDWFKAKNPTVFMIVQAALVAVYAGVNTAIGTGLVGVTPILEGIIEYGAVILMALVGTRTVTKLPDDFDPGNFTERLAKILDSFKTRNPKAFAAIQTALLGVFAVLTYGGLPITEVTETVLQVVTMLAIIVGGSRTGRYK